MKYLIDTNVCIRYLNGRSSAVRDKIRSCHPSDIVICSVVRAELFHGAMKSDFPEKTLEKLMKFFAPFPTLVFDDSVARCFGEIRANLEKKGTPIGPYDLLIAAIAMRYHLIVVTHNTREFSRIAELKLEDWEQ